MPGPGRPTPGQPGEPADPRQQAPADFEWPTVDDDFDEPAVEEVRQSGSGYVDPPTVQVQRLNQGPRPPQGPPGQQGGPGASRPRDAAQQAPVDPPTRPVQRPQQQPDPARQQRPAVESPTTQFARPLPPQERPQPPRETVGQDTYGQGGQRPEPLRAEQQRPEPLRAEPRRIEPPSSEPPPSLPVEPEPAEHENDAPEVTRKGGRGRRKMLIIAGALILVIALGVGVVVGGDKLGLFGTKAAAIQPPPSPTAVVPALRPVGAGSPAPTPQALAAVLDPLAAAAQLGTLGGAVVDPATGTTLWKKGDTALLTPASSAKLLTAAAALLSLNHADQLSTKVVAGTEPGTVVLIGGGDPTLDSTPAGKENRYPGSAKLADLVNQVKQSAGGTISKVVYDISRYPGPDFANGWDATDIAGGSITHLEPLMIDGGRVDPTEDKPRVANAAQTAADAFARGLGVSAPAVKGAAPQGTKVLGEVRSAPVEQLVANLLQISDNVLAEAMAREVARVNGADQSFTGAAKAVRDVLTKNGFDLSGVVLNDGSGLSLGDKVPAKLFADIVTAAAKPDTAGDEKTAKLRPLLAGLPVAGGSGTLSGRYVSGQTAVGRGWLRAKTGTLSNVNSLAGLVVDNEGRLLVFAFMSNVAQEPDLGAARPYLDTLAAALRNCGCH
ncbi:D-alanyl-D-alanine carboxypeptidase/D-alanyl-D-alanine-endopeptidase [Solihabitans fulvus]|uniref:D-alanyl-D-alanine carboxypeptidase/D-alanyl-D-alanine-endopeptidase n=1 Tax=Solihabitans fulvus TaxID=1892852 RepID=A0A5B2XHD6_9PSEU|nr:D-alanyl-D-alanine carboxypeptidase/D-alanyl-D-alanine-endopeptidase [Solihabitans fulvus]KAA2262301.1 D-alanyl-D-alanine carboxypeptidase/D-alanyl-D-alanine-endopeptidase [Solihabitans fulvus]